MSNGEKTIVTRNAWQNLKQFTDARIGLGRAGVSLPTSEMLAFQLAHARARDAVHFPLNIDQLIGDLQQYPVIAKLGDPVILSSQAEDRFTYLQRPDLGRQLSRQSRDQLAKTLGSTTPDLALVIADGLSSAAIQRHAAPFLSCLLEALQGNWSLAPLSLVQQGRVAIGDDIGQCLQARMVVVLIGERPGLSAADGLGIYLSFNPRKGLSDAQRNCISNVRPAGLSFEDASQRLLYLIREADRLELTGVGLKDRSEDITIEEADASGSNFLIS